MSVFKCRFDTSQVIGFPHLNIGAVETRQIKKKKNMSSVFSGRCANVFSGVLTVRASDFGSGVPVRSVCPVSLTVYIVVNALLACPCAWNDQ